MQVELLHRKATPTGVNLIVRMPNGIALAIREWMTHPEAALIPISDRPLLPRGALSDLRAVVDTFLGSVAEDGGSGDGETANGAPEGAVRSGRAGRVLRDGRREELLELLARLLREAATGSPSRGTGRLDDEPDHA